MLSDVMTSMDDRITRDMGFDHHPRTRLLYGPHTVDRIGNLLQELGAQRVLVVTDAGIVAAGHLRRVVRAVQKAGLVVTVFDQVHENPTTRDVDACLEAARKAADIDTIVGLGGGSSLDTAKGCNFLLTNGGKMSDYWGLSKAARPMLPMIAVPTTAGTGSECQSFAVIVDEQTHQKMACGDPKAAPRVAILDPTLTITQPHDVAACSGMDAVAHAVETAVTRPRSPFSLMYAHQAFRLTAASLPVVLSVPNDLEARGRMHLGAAFAGTAIENSMLGAAHAAANPLTAYFGVVHGQAVGMMLPHVVRFNAEHESVRRFYADLVQRSHLGISSDNDTSAVNALVDCLAELLRTAGLKCALAQCGVPRGTLADLAREASQQWTAAFNPRPVSAVDFERLYANAYE